MKHLSQAVKVGILAIVAVVGGVVIWRSIGGPATADGEFRTWATMRDVAGVPDGSAVMVAGLRIGVVSKRSIYGRLARVDLQLSDDIKIWSNATLHKKSSSLLGTYYLEIDPGIEGGKDIDGNPVRVLKSGERIRTVVEATTPGELMQRIEESLPNVDAVLLSARDLVADLRRVVNGPVSSIASRIDKLVQDESETISSILRRADAAAARIEQITRDIRSVTGNADAKVSKILDQIDDASLEAKELLAKTKSEVELTGQKVREKLDLVDEVLSSSGSIAKKIDGDQGTLGRLVNDSTIADNIEDVTEDAKGFLGTLFRMQSYVGLRSEYNWFARAARHYITAELSTRPDKFYYIELEKGPRGDYPVVDLVYDPTIDRSQFVRKVRIEDKVRFTFQFGRRYKSLAFRYGLKESTGGVGLDSYWFDDKMKLSVDLFDATFDRFPRLKITAAINLWRYLYILGGADELLNSSDQLVIDSGAFDVPIQFEEFHFGRDYFLGAMLRFNDQDLTTLLTVGGAALLGAATD